MFSSNYTIYIDGADAITRGGSLRFPIILDLTIVFFPFNFLSNDYTSFVLLLLKDLESDGVIAGVGI